MVFYDANYHLADRMMDVRKRNKKCKLRIKRAGLPDESGTAPKPLELYQKTSPG